MKSNDNTPHHFSLLLIAGALCFGLFAFALIVLFLITKGDWIFELTPLTIIASIGAISILPASFIVPIFVSRNTAKMLGQALTPEQKKDTAVVARSAMRVLQSSTIIRFALIEGAAIFLLVVSLIEKNFLPWCVAVALIALMISQLPFKGRFDEAIAAISERIRDAK